MALPLPKLDDRTFEMLLAEAQAQIGRSAPDWTDLSPSDPGMVMLELYTHLTEVMIYRLNRLPDKAYHAFLRLLGVMLQPPAAASVVLQFTREQAEGKPLTIPRGTRVGAERSGRSSEAIVFMTVQAATILANETAVSVRAYHCEQISWEQLRPERGVYKVQRPPIVAPTGQPLNLMVGVEATAAELEEGAPAVKFRGRSYRIWQEVKNFTNLGQQRHVYVVDRLTGVITFAPSARMMQPDGTLSPTAVPLAAVPEEGRDIRVWYWRGGGAAGNVAAHKLTVMKDPISGASVTNPQPASGGQAAETLENGLIRGPQELHSLQRAITAQDFETVAQNSARAVARSKALTRAEQWQHARPGAVEVLLVPHLPTVERAPGMVTAVSLKQRETEVAREQVQQALDERRPLGTTCAVNWTNYKTVRVTARVVVGREENQTAVKRRVLERLHQTITPLPTGINPTGWSFGQALRASDVYNIALAEPGVRWVDGVRLHVDEVPETAVSTVAADHFQPNCWYVGSGETLFRSLNDGAGWEATRHFATQTIQLIEPNPNANGKGHVALVSETGDGNARLYLSRDAGESWGLLAELAFSVNDLAWTVRDQLPMLLLATDKGLYELPLTPNASPVQVVVNPSDQTLSFYAVTAVNLRGTISVAVAAQGQGGVYLSSENGRSGSFQSIGQQGVDIRRLAVQVDGPRAFLWAGAFAEGPRDAGRGCFRWELRGAEAPAEGWRDFGENWTGGSCRGITFLGNRVVASSHRGGVLWLEPTRSASWTASDVNAGLPQRDQEGGQLRFQPVMGIAANAQTNLVLAGGPLGVYRSQDGGQQFAAASSKTFLEKVTLPGTWLFVSGAHDVEVVSEDEANRD
ncbi:MAG: baseplate J/gp47 family protein [Chloroflexota bacterium]